MEAAKISEERSERKGVRLIVTDSGVGIPEKQLEHVFDAFYQSENSISKTQEGSGLGLAIVKKLVAALHGTMLISSKIEHGTSITLEFFWTQSLLPMQNNGKFRHLF